MSDDEIYAALKNGSLVIKKRAHHRLRFWKFTDKNGPVVSKYGRCWIWTGPKRNGYGRFAVNDFKTNAHRYSYSIHYGEFPRHLDVLHKCDNPSCVRPGHLFLGNDRDNVADMCRKGRQAKGEKKVTAKMTEDGVRELRRLRRDDPKTYTYRALSERYGVSKEVVCGIIKNVFWKHVT